MFRIGDKVLHQFNRDLGPGEVVAVQGGRMGIRFPRSGDVLQFAVEDHAFVPLVLPPGADPERWYIDYSDDIAERLVRREVDPVRAFRNRLDGLRLSRIREAGGLGSYLGGRIEIFPHQLHVAELAFRADPVRWLLADEVGLGKTVEACLILSRLLRAGRAEKVLIVAPSTLTVQWLGELYRKFHQIFVLLDADRREDVLKDHGPDFNAFDIHPRSVLSIEDLVADTRAQKQAAEAQLDLLVVDEAHRLERRPGHPGNAAYRAVAPLAASARNVLLLSATPLEADQHGFYRLLELLWPAEFPSWEKFQADLAEGVPLYPCTSSTTRADIGGLPPRVPLPVELPAWPELLAAEAAALALPAGNVLERKRRALAVEAAQCAPHGAGDPRIAWIAAEMRGWAKQGEKNLVFVSTKDALDLVKKELEFQTGQRVAVFHENLSPGQRDIEVAQFAQSDGPGLLLSTECGGEGRNFQFCRRIVLFDLPWNPALVEQRIGRLDRINRRRPVDIVYFKPSAGFALPVAELYEALGVFREPLGGLERSLTHVEEAVEAAALTAEPSLDIGAIIEETRRARAEMTRSVYHHLHQNRYRPELAAGILARIPPELERITEDVVVTACQQFGFDVIDRPEQKTWYVEFGATALIEYLPGATSGSRWLGTFDRETAVARESLDFFASGHPLVEGILMELEDGHRGSVALLALPGAGVAAFGLVVVLKIGAEFVVHILDTNGVAHPEWDPLLFGRGARAVDIHPGQWNPPEGYDDWVRQVMQVARDVGRPVGVAGVQVLV
jgi:ATP-dependent helicase HepA